MKILIAATKLPWPPRDGGRLALWLTLRGLADAGHTVDLVAPVDTRPDAATQAALAGVCVAHPVMVARRPWPVAAIHAIRNGCGLSVARHHYPAVEHVVARCIADTRPDVVHVEQLQALSNCARARAAGVPILLRMQNVESSLWQQVALARLLRRPLLLEAHRMRADERRALGLVQRVVALTERDARSLQRIGGSAHKDKIVAIGPAYPAGQSAAAAVAGTPSLVLAGSSGWWPSQSGIRWFIDQVVPPLLAALTSARVHVYGGPHLRRPGVIWHAAPDDAQDAFPTGAIAVIPLHVGSGIRMRILEAWARGLPVVATPTAAAGLWIESGREMLLARTPSEFLLAIRRLVAEPGLRDTLVKNGRLYLRRHHDSHAVTEALVAQYRIAAA